MCCGLPGLLYGREGGEYLLRSLLSAMTGTVQDSEKRLTQMDFIITVGLFKLSQVIAYIHDVDEEARGRLHTKCAEEAKRINGAIDFANAYKYQNRIS